MSLRGHSKSAWTRGKSFSCEVARCEQFTTNIQALDWFPRGIPERQFWFILLILLNTLAGGREEKIPLHSLYTYRKRFSESSIVSIAIFHVPLAQRTQAISLIFFIQLVKIFASIRLRLLYFFSVKDFWFCYAKFLSSWTKTGENLNAF